MKTRKLKPYEGDKFDNMHHLSHNRKHVDKSKLKCGTLTGLTPVKVDSRTVVFVKAGHDPEKVARNYRLHRDTLDSGVKRIGSFGMVKHEGVDFSNVDPPQGL